MRGAYYRSGQAARAWGISSHLVRRLCELGQIEAELTDGGQWKIPHGEVERIRKEGVPEIPSSMESDERENEKEKDDETPNGLLAPPSEGVVTSAEEVVVAENRLRKLRIDKETEETRDWFRDRQRSETEIASQEQQIALEKAAHSRAERDQIVWHDSWLAAALLLLPQEAPTEIRLVVRETVTEALTGLGPRHSRQVIEPLVTAAVVKALQPWTRARQTTRAIEKAFEILPWGAKNLFSPTVWQVRATELASTAVRKLTTDSTYEEKLSSATTAVRQVSAEFEASELRKRILEDYWWDIRAEDREDAKEAVKKKLEGLPVGTSASTMERVRDQALAPFREARKRNEQVDLALRHVRRYLDELQRAGETDFDSDRDVWHFAKNLERKVRPVLAEELQNNNLSDDELIESVEEMVDEALG